MDKLQPILKNHFWILLVPLFSMNLWGYFSANSQLRAATEARQKELDSVKSAIPAGATDPNASYTEELKKTNDLLVSFVDKEMLDLWNRQKKRMIWPAVVADEIPKVYKSEIKSKKVRLAYQKEFTFTRKRVYEIVEPYVLDRKLITWTPKVDFPIEFINPYWAPTSMAIESQTMWDNQEDLWLTQLLLEAIREVNKDADSESSAMIRRVINFRLLGGNGESSVMPSEGGGESDYGDEDGGSTARRPMGPAAAVMTSVAFDPSEEFGTGGDPSMMTNGRAMASFSEDEEEVSEEPTGPLRYVKEDEAAPFVQRGFYLSVIIDQDKMVDFLVALANSEWPIEVTRFHFGRNPYGGPDPFNARSAGTNNMAGRPGSFRSDGDDDGDGMFRGGVGGGGGGFARPMNVPGPPRQAEDGGFGFGALGKGGQLGGGGGGAPRGVPTPGNSGYPPDALLQPDLVQLDLTGLITIYRQPKSEIPEEGAEPSSGEAAPADESADAAEGEMASEEAVAPATEGEGETPAETADAAKANAEPEMEKDSGADAAATAESEAAAADEFAEESSTGKAASEAPVAEPAVEGPPPAGDTAPAEEAPAADGNADDEFSSPKVPSTEPAKAPVAPEVPEKPSTP